MSTPGDCAGPHLGPAFAADASKTIQAIRGMHDVTPACSDTWQRLEDTARAVLTGYGYSEIRTPIVESSDLFKINSLSDAPERAAYREELVCILDGHRDQLDADSRRRLTANPRRYSTPRAPRRRRSSPRPQPSWTAWGPKPATTARPSGPNLTLPPSLTGSFRAWCAD